jgi:hypothetical protein
MKGITFLAKTPMLEAMRVIKEMHSIGPVILQFLSHFFDHSLHRGDFDLVDHGVWKESDCWHFLATSLGLLLLSDGTKKRRVGMS